MSIETRNPTTGEIIKTYSYMSEQEVNEIITKTQTAYLNWRDLTINERAEKLFKVAELLNKNTNSYAEIITAEMGKPIKAARDEVKKCARVCEHYANHAAKYLAPQVIATDMKKSFVTYKPLGIIFGIMPWNFPFWQVFRYAVPTLMAGNACLLKHAPISTGTALVIEKIFQEAGLPQNLFRALILDNEGAAKVIAHRLVVAVTLTGSARAGSEVGALAAKNLKKIVLELGGSDPYVILEDADLEQAAEACVRSRLNNSGQVCIAAKRIIIVNTVAEKFKNLILEKVKNYVMGDPSDEATNFGPMARQDLRDEVHRQVQASIAKGAQCLLGGKIPEKRGFYYPPTILDNITTGMPAYNEELFGPVICFFNAKDENEAINIANDSTYGLAGAVFTQDIKRGEKIAAEKIQAGCCAVNTFITSDPRLPFGGIKQSGYGRELGEEGIKAFVNIKTVVVK